MTKPKDEPETHVVETPDGKFEVATGVEPLKRPEPETPPRKPKAS